MRENENRSLEKRKEKEGESKAGSNEKQNRSGGESGIEMLKNKTGAGENKKQEEQKKQGEAALPPSTPARHASAVRRKNSLRGPCR